MQQSLLGRVDRKGIGWQVTYAGHPLYLFDCAPGQVTGEGWFEPGLPPWHAVWWLISANGEPLPWAGTLTTTKINGKTVLAESYLTGAGWGQLAGVHVQWRPGLRHVNLRAKPSCARAWPEVLTSGSAGDQACGRPAFGEISLAGGLPQVTWYGQLLYLFSNEQAALNANGSPAPLGNGNNVRAFGGTFHLVYNP